VLETEAARICDILFDLGDSSPLLNLGSSTRRFREVTRPHIERELFAPLRRAGVTVLHSDLKVGEGVDVAGDLLDPMLLTRFKAMGFRCVLLSNVLEHVRDRPAVTAACEAMVGPGGYVLATVPSSYPFHADPIDTYYRPTPQALALAFVRSRPVVMEEVVGPTYAEDLGAEGTSVWQALTQTLLWLLAAPVRPKSFLARAHRWLWYSRPWRVSLVLVQVR
jgi:hypothetical protein